MDWRERLGANGGAATPLDAETRAALEGLGRFAIPPTSVAASATSAHPAASFAAAGEGFIASGGADEQPSPLASPREMTPEELAADKDRRLRQANPIEVRCVCVCVCV